MHLVHHFHYGESLFAILQFVFQHTHQSVVREQIPENISLRIFQNLAWRIFYYSRRVFTQQEGIVGNFRIEQPARVAKNFVQQKIE